MTGIKADRRAKELAIPYGHDVTGSQVDRHTLLRGHGCRSVREGLAPPATADLCRLSGWTEAHPYDGRKLFGGVRNRSGFRPTKGKPGSGAEPGLRKNCCWE